MKKLLLLLLMLMPVVSAASTDISISLLNQDPDPAFAGDVVEIRIGVENRGEAASGKMVFELIPQYPFEQVNNEDLQQVITNLGAYLYDDDFKVLKYLVRINEDAIAGEYNLNFDYYSSDAPEYRIQEEVVVDIKNRESAEVIYIDKVELMPGKQTPMKFTINNVGNAPLRELTFHWENEDGIILPVGSDDTKYIKYIDVGESTQFEYQVIASSNAEPDLYRLDLRLSYDDPVTNEEKLIETAAGVYVGGKTDFDIAFSGASKGDTSFSISNIGSVQASSVTVKVPKQPGWKVTGTNSVIIGNLNKGDYTIATFGLMPSSNESIRKMQDRTSPVLDGAKDVSVQISYTDTRGERYVVDKVVSVNLAALKDEQSMVGKRGNGQSSNTTYYVLAFVAVIILMYFWNKRKKKK